MAAQFTTFQHTTKATDQKKNMKKSIESMAWNGQNRVGFRQTVRK